MNTEITWADFTKVELRVGKVVHAEVFAQARKPAYILQVDFGPELGLRKSSAQITDHYRAEELVGRLVVAVVNFPKKKLALSSPSAWSQAFMMPTAMSLCACLIWMFRWGHACYENATA